MPRLLIYVFCLFSLSLLAEETIIVGTVRDSRSGLPVENANVWYRNTDIGCASNSEGVFMLRTDLQKKRTLLVSAVGYKRQKYPVEPGQYAGIEIMLEEENTQLEDIFVLPGENPALPLMEKIRERRLANDKWLQQGVSYSQNEQQELFISDIRQKHLQRLLWRSLSSGMLTSEDSTLMLPLYSYKAQSVVSAGRKSLLSAPQTKSLVLTETDYSLLLEGLPEHFDFYRNTITVFSQNFISPLASSGNSHYAYYLADSLLTDSLHKQYVVHFKSKNPYEPSFNGEMTVDSASCGIRSITVSVPREVSVNYLTSLRLTQTYDSLLLPQTSNMSMIFDFAVKADTSHVFPTVLLKRSSTTVSSAGVQQSADSVNSTIVNNSIINDTVLTTTDSAFQILQENPVIRFGKFVAHIVTTGNIPTGEKVDIGNIVELIGWNREEGFHLGVPLTTNEKLWKNVELSGYVAYGFGDRALKGKGQIRALLPSDRRHLLGAYYWDHYASTDVSLSDCLLRENDIFYGDADFAHLIFSEIRYAGQTASSRTRKREFRVWVENDWTDNIETTFAFSMGRMGYGPASVGYYDIPSFRYRTLQAVLRVGWKERKADIYMRRVHVHSSYPVLRLIAEAGSWQMDGKDLKGRDLNPKTVESYTQSNPYARLVLQVQQTVPLGMLGRLDYAAEAGIVIGTVPYPLLGHFTGNQSCTYDPYRFTLMNSYQYAADRFMSLHLHWNMQGAVFNRIPYLQRLHLRELVEAKVAWGWLSDKHSQVVALPDGMSAMRVPYVEAGIGIGNILRVADLYAIFRLTDFKNTTTPWWAVRARFSLGL